MSRHMLLLAIATTIFTTPILAVANQDAPTRDTLLGTTWGLFEPLLSMPMMDGLKGFARRGVFRDCRMPAAVPIYVFPETVKNVPIVDCSDVPVAVLKLQVALDKATYQPGESIVAVATRSQCRQRRSHRAPG